MSVRQNTQQEHQFLFLLLSTFALHEARASTSNTSTSSSSSLLLSSSQFLPPPLSSSTRLSQAYLHLLSSSWTPPPLVPTGLHLGTDSLFTYKHSGRLPVLVLVLVVICNSYPPSLSLSCPPSHFKKHRICIEHVNIIIVINISAIPRPSLSLSTCKSLTSFS